MASYRFNTPIVGGKFTLWFRTLLALYESQRPLRKKEWLTATGIQFSDETVLSGRWKGSKKYSYRHWRGLYPDMFARFRGRGWVEYDREACTWKVCDGKFIDLVMALDVPDIHVAVWNSWKKTVTETDIDAALEKIDILPIMVVN